MGILKKAILFIIVLALCFAFGGVVYAEGEQLDDSRYIRVGLFWGMNSKSSVRLSCSNGFTLYDGNGNKLQDIAETTLDIDTASQYLANRESRIFMARGEDEDSRIVTLSTDKGTKQYRDGILLYENRGLRVINYVTVEHYVWGVVNREMSSSNPLEALKAQAVAARTYALRIKYSASDSGHHNYGFDVCATTDCQVYGAYSSESDVTTRACRETEGLIALYNGAPAFAYFSAYSGGGYTMSLYDAWGLDDLPYLRTAPDVYTPEYHWETDYRFETIRQRILDYYKEDIGSVLRFEISDRNESGAVTGIIVTGSNGSKKIPRSQIMAVFNLKSTFFCIGNSGYKTIEKEEPTAESYYVLSAGGLETVPTSGLYVYDGNAVSKLPVKYSASYTMENDICTDGMVYMRGLGYGHGIGMSQRGAIIMARDYAKSYADILNYYYPGITIEHY